MDKKDYKNYKPTLEEKVLTDINERFVGDVLDEKKKARLDEIKTLCREIAESDHDIKYLPAMFSNKSQNGSARLDIPNAMLLKGKSKNLLSRVIGLSDSVTVAQVRDKIRISSHVSDMWNEYHYTEEV